MAVVESCRFDVLLAALDPSRGAEINKTRPCIVISPDEMNKCLKTLIVAPMTTMIKDYPTRVPLTFGGKEGEIVLDQIRAIDKTGIIKKLGTLDRETSTRILDTLGQMFS